MEKNKNNLSQINPKKVRFFGFEYELKPFCIIMGCALAALLLLVALTLFGVDISWYGVLFGLGFLVALALSSQLCKERQIDKEFPFSLVWWVFPCSIIGARLYFIIFNGGVNSFIDVIAIWKGGLAIYGGIIGGLIGLIICCLIHKVNIIKMTDVVAPLLSIGQGFGRIGCIFGHCCYGVKVASKSLHWFPISIFVDGDWHLATNFYESVLDFALFFVLTIVLRKTKITGLPTCAYLVGYGIIRFVLETFRDQDQTLFVGNYPVSKLVSIICVLVGTIGICILLLVHNNRAKVESADIK